MNPGMPKDARERAVLVQQVVIEYLRKRGYRSTERELLAEISKEADASYDDESRNAMMIINRSMRGYDEQPMMYEEMYRELRDWADGSLDLYKGELHSVLYPHMVHCFLEMVKRGASADAQRFLKKYGKEFMANSEKRAEELRTLMGVTSTQILQENETAKLFLNNRYELFLSSYALELLLAFLTDNPRRYLLLRILNHNCRILDHTIPTAGNLLDGASGFFATEEQKALASKEVLWGTLKEKEYIKADETDDKDASDNKGKEEEEEEKKPPHVEADGSLSEALVPIPKYRVGATGLENLTANTKGRVALSRSSLPSCLFYTFANTRGCAMNCLTMSADASLVAAGFQESSVRVWDYKSGQQHGTKLVGHSGPVFAVDMSFCSQFLLSGSEDGTARLWSIPLKSDLVAFRGHNHPIWSVAWGPYGHYFVTGSHDSTARIWSTERISPLRILSGHLSDVEATVWHPNCTYVATGSTDLTSRLWDLRVGDCVRVFGTHSGPLQALAFSPNGRYLAMSGNTKDIHVWDIAEGRQVQRLKGHEASVWHLAYSCEGSVLASASADNTVRVWDATTSGGGKKLLGGASPVSATVNGTPEAGGKADGPAKTSTTPMDTAGSTTGSAAAPAASPTTSAGTAAASWGGQPSTSAHLSQKTESPLLCTLRTKRTPAFYVRFTRKNLMVAGGAYGC
ncbi:hypothetical protein NDN08_004807 [Rhodosorus marinus]|uniref:TFIID subunit TAF5 NTD2 domain-containing protein n=1 Tax=Rhodosorus marinus TaxID=101924 RepID=A0AAV8UQD7_9RHOD|nr:hypothetical protein NDN08_004807 [Rhodosorus marinus]